MDKSKIFLLIKRILSIITISMIGVVSIVFCVLYVETFDTGFFNEYSSLIIAVGVAIITAITVLTIWFFEAKLDIVYKLFLLTIVFVAIILTGLYLLKITGFFDKIKTVQDLRDYIASFGSFASVLFVILQFAQVVVLPIPSFITVGAGVLLFGALKGAILSCVGIITGSVVAFLIGRVFGVKVAKWLVGKDGLDKGLKLIKGKDKVVLTFMFLFPLFPDDVLCFVAGITTIGPIYFVVMIFIVRIITIFLSSYSMNNSIVPYNTWWGILIWILLFVITLVLVYFVYKYGDKIEKWFKYKFARKKQRK